LASVYLPTVGAEAVIAPCHAQCNDMHTLGRIPLDKGSARHRDSQLDYSN